MRARTAIAIELGLLAAAAAGAWWLGGVATDAWLDRAGRIPDVRVPDEGVVRAAGHRAQLLFDVGVIVLAAARTLAARRGRTASAAPWLVPAATFACLLGLVVHQATVEVSRGAVALPASTGFAEGFLLGSVAAAGLLVVPFDLALLAGRYRRVLGAAIAAIFVALAIAGGGPGGTRINLGPIQPIEAVKPLMVLFLAGFLGVRASKLRWQRRRIAGLEWPRLELMGPAIGAMLGLFAGLFLIGDLGPVLVLSLVFLGMFALVTRATGFAAVALALVAGFVAVLARWPGLADVGTVETRLRMWIDPWGNGMSHGDQLGQGLWAIAAGGWSGQGLAEHTTPLIPAGQTDLVLATMMEQLGVAGLALYLALLGAIVAGALRIAARSRTAERALIAGGAALLLVAQLAVIAAGTFGLLPLTGIVVPLLSTGRSSMIAFLVVIAILARLGDDAPARVETAELDELRGGNRAIAIASGVVLAAGLVVAIRIAVIDRASIAATGIRVELADGTRITRADPRLVAVAAQIRRGTIADRDGRPLAVSPVAGVRLYPLGPDLGTLLGAWPSRVLLPPWALERALDHRLAGDALRDLAPLVSLPPDERRTRIAALDADVASRSVRLTLDARLQARIAAILRARLARGGHAAAAVVIDVETGEVLARVQAPDLDPRDSSWQSAILARDPRVLPELEGAYGAWPDKTGVQGMFQAGSVGKLFTAIAAVRAGRAGDRYPCVDEDAQGPFYVQRGWDRPVHDHGDDRTHGEVDLIEGLAVSCNVYFAQLALRLREPLIALRAAGLEIGYADTLDPGPAESRRLASTGFGQGALVLSAMQAARMVAAIGAGGVYRRCPSTMELGAPCPETRLVDDPEALAPILEGMRRVMTAGTGKHLRPPDGVVVHGKTGTADVRGFDGEAPWGIAPGAAAAPHSWFVAFATGIDGGRALALAVVVPRGGAGAATAGPLAMQILAAARDLGYLGGEP